MNQVDKQEKDCEGPEGSYGGHDLEGRSGFLVSGGKKTTDTDTRTNTLGESKCKPIARHIVVPQ